MELELETIDNEIIIYIVCPCFISDVAYRSRHQKQTAIGNKYLRAV